METPTYTHKALCQRLLPFGFGHRVGADDDEIKFASDFKHLCPAQAVLMPTGHLGHF